MEKRLLTPKIRLSQYSDITGIRDFFFERKLTNHVRYENRPPGQAIVQFLIQRLRHDRRKYHTFHDCLRHTCL